MEQRDKEWFVISSGVAPLYSTANFDSRCLTEMVYGDSCKIITIKESWLFVKLDDSYQGWVKSFYGKRTKLKNNPSYIVVYPNGKGIYHPKYPFGAKLNKKRLGSVPIGQKLDLNNLTSLLDNFVDVPYKWGGKSSLGFDCSGLVQSVFQVFGLELPRDSKDQWNFLEPYKIDLNKAKLGDLHFFRKNGRVVHVAISCGGLNFIHAQGHVKKESLDKEDNRFNQSLLDTYHASASIRLKFGL